MRRLIVTEFMTLDGNIGEPSWSGPYWGDDILQFKVAETEDSDTILVGRRTYDIFAAAWPHETEDELFGYMNSVEKVVVSKTLSDLHWQNSHLLEGELIPGINALKARDGKDIVVHGSGTLARSLIKAGLVDSIHLVVFPLTVGEGPHLFEEGMANKYRLVEAKPFASGAVGLVYEPAE
nr:H148 [uncultured bacterium]